uniref:Ig-like domain-containing protein n=1 Tax=Podarcis muralis TaxID=64176 RepID=A0A670HMT1_PODMU
GSPSLPKSLTSLPHLPCLPPTVQPKVKITPTDNVESSPHNTLLICTVNRFFPAGIEIKWFRNGKEEPKVWTTDLIRNGDWTFHIEVMLETNPERGDVYTCQVEHASFEGPVTVQWDLSLLSNI